MPIVNHFYNRTTRRYIALFGSLFNKMMITRDDNDGNEIQKMIVPLSYGPYQKFLARIKQDPNLDRPQAISLPRMAFEIQSMSHSPERKAGTTVNKIKTTRTDSLGNEYPSSVFVPAPYDIEFSLYIMTKYAEDGTKIIEQIIPFFNPEYTFTAHIIDGMSSLDIPLTLNSIQPEDIYDGDFETRRSLMWTLNFTMKVWYFGPVRDRKVIKFVDVRTHHSLESDAPVVEQITVQPGLTVYGTPTTDINETIPYEEINEDDDWGFITIINESVEEDEED